MACLNMRPFHGLHRPKPASASQFFLRQSSLTYTPGQNITVEVLTHSNERNFRGFMVQAYDPVNGLRIGKFLPNKDSQPMPCSAATHRNHQDKHSATLTWVDSAETREDSHAAALSSGLGTGPAAVATLGNWLGIPINGGDGGARPIEKRHVDGESQQTPLRQVRFRGTIVVTYAEYYTEFESSELNFAKWDYSQAASSGLSR